MKNKEDTEEAFQDTFMKIYRSLENYNYTSSFGTWAYRIAYNTGIDYLRKRKRQATIALDDHHDVIAEAQIPIEKEDLNRKLENYLSLLSLEDEQIIRLYYLRELSIQEVEEIMEFSKAKIKTKLFRSRKKLLDLMSDEDIAEFKNYYNE